MSCTFLSRVFANIFKTLWALCHVYLYFFIFNRTQWMKFYYEIIFFSLHCWIRGGHNNMRMMDGNQNHWLINYTGCVYRLLLSAPSQHQTRQVSVQVNVSSHTRSIPVPDHVPGPAGCQWYAEVVFVISRGCDVSFQQRGAGARQEVVPRKPFKRAYDFQNKGKCQN